MRSSVLLLLLLLRAWATGSRSLGMPPAGWANHQLRVAAAQPTSAINASNLPDSFFGVEGGHLVQVGGWLYVVLTEFNAPPLWVPSRIALWRAPLPQGAIATDPWPTGAWQRLRTLFTSTGHVDCNSTRASLGSSASLAYNAATSRWEVYYVGFVSCNDSMFVNRDARIFRAVSTVAGPGQGGIEGAYVDVGVIMQPNATQSGTSSMQPFMLGQGRGWAGFFGVSCCRHHGDPSKLWDAQVGLATAPTPAGPWSRPGDGVDDGQPTNLSALALHIEQPMITRLRDGSFVAFFDALQSQSHGLIGYSWSEDGLQWDARCTQLLDVAHACSGNATWMLTGIARTPQGVVELVDGSLLLSFSGYDTPLPPHKQLHPNKQGSNGFHESMGLALLQFAR